MIKHPCKVKQPGYEPERQLLAAVVLEAVRDCSTQRQVTLQDRETAKAFLAGEEGSAWLRVFGISARKARAFIDSGYQILNDGA